MRASSAATKAAPKPAIKQRALVVGVSTYPSPLNNLPGVANDVAAVAKLLTSKNGAFRSTGVMLLTESAANRKDVLVALQRVFSGAKTDDTVFVYFAGHGGVEKSAYYFLAQDTDPRRLTETGVSLAEIKRLFDGTRSKRVFVWLDCCHSGGIISRTGTVASDKQVIRRQIEVLQGEGKIIMAACTPSQYAYEDHGTGHGLFTHALLRGLKGDAKGAQGDVTAASLYDFVAHEVKHPDQQPVFSGQMTGRIVLMHYPTGAPAPTTKAAVMPAKGTRAGAGKISSSGKLLLLANHVYSARSAAETNDATWNIEITPKTAEEEASLRALRSDRYGRSESVSFAFGNQAFKAQISDVGFKTAASGAICTVVLKPASEGRNHMLDMEYNGLTSAQLAELRARFLLLDEKPEARTASTDSFRSSFIMHPLNDAGITGAIIPSLRSGRTTMSADFLRRARLHLVYALRVAEICNDILELALGPERQGGLSVRFRGRKKSRYSSGLDQEITVVGVCPV